MSDGCQQESRTIERNLIDQLRAISQRMLLNSIEGPTVEKAQMLLIGSNETFGCTVLRIDKHDVLWIAAWGVDCEEDDRVFQYLRLRVHRSALEKEQLSGAELGAGAFIFHPECAPA